MAKFVLTAEIVLQAPKNVNQVVNNIQSQLNNIQANVNIQGASAANKQIQQLTNSTNQASSAAQKMGKSFTASVRRFSALAIATRAVSLFTNTLGGAIKESIAFERELVKISQVTGKSISGLNKLTKTVSDLSTGLGVSSTSLLSVSRILAQTGLSAKETEIALGTLARTELAPTFDNISQTAEGAVAILNQFGQGASALEAQLGSLNAVAGSFAVEAGDLVAAIRRTGGVFKSAGGDLNELIALFTSVRATTRESAESIATGLRTIFTRIQRPETIDYLRQFGVELTDIEGKFVGPYEATKRLSEALAGLGERDLKFVEIAEQLGGFRQIGKVLPLLQQFTVAQSALKTAQEGQDSLATDAAKAQAALAVQITKVKEEFLELVRNFSASTSFQMMADTVLSLASALIKLADTLAPVLPLLTAFAGIKLAGAAFGAIGGLGKTLGFNQGGQVPHAGKVHHFATGGMVPGTGNGDTVPAMLTPGEFVIKKSSVKKLGAENLSEMNSGGAVRKYAPGTGSGGVSPLTKREQANAKAKATRDRKREERTQKRIDAGEYVIKRVEVPFEFGLAYARGTDGSGGVESLISEVANTAKGGAIGATTLQQSIINQVNRNTKDQVQTWKEAKTYLAEGAKIKAPNAREYGMKPDAQKIFTDDLVGGIPKLMNNAVSSFRGSEFGPFPQYTLPQVLSNSAIGSIEGYMFEAFLNAASGNIAKDNTVKDEVFDITSIEPSELTKLFGESILPFTELKNRPSQGAIASAIGKAMNQGKGEGLKYFADGGAAKGQDTVPAMLTPGEFVVNKKSAKSIGYGNLHRMNKAGKYAKGGVVHRFGNGTGSSGVPSGGGAGIDVSGLQSALGNLSSSLTDVIAQLQAYSDANVTATESTKSAGKAAKEGGDVLDKNKKGGLEAVVALGILTTGLNMLTPTIDESSGAFDYLANSLAAGATQLVTFTGLMSQFGGFEVLAKGLNNITAVTQDVKGSMKSLGKGIKSGLSSVTGFGTAAKAAAAANVANSSANTANTVATGGNTAAANTSGVALVANAVAAMWSAGGLSTLAVVVLGAVAGFALLAAGFSIVTGAMAGYAKALKDKAVEDGDIEAAGEAASDEQGWNQLQDSLWSVVVPFGALGETISFFNGDMGRARKAAISRARADAALSKSAKEVTKAEEDAASAFKEFEAGTRSIGSVLAATAESGKAVIESQKEVAAANMAAQRAVVTFWSSLGSGLKSFFGTSFGLSTIEDNQKKADTEGEARTNEQKSREASFISANQQGTSALMRQVAAAGGGIDDFYARLKASNEPLYNLVVGTEAVENAFKNIEEQAQKTREAFEAMNLGFQSVNGAAGALLLGVENLMRGMDSGASQLESTIATLEAGVTNAAQGMSGGQWDKAMGEATSALRSLGASEDKIEKFEKNLSAVNAAQKFYAEAADDARNEMMQDFQKGLGTGGKTPTQQKEILATSIAGVIPDDLGPEVKERILAAVKGMEISDKDMEALQGGDLSVLDEILAELGEDTLEQVKSAFEALQAVEEQRLKIVANLVKLEEQLLDARQKTLDTEIQARELEEKYGGRKFSAEEQKGLLFEKGNVREGLPQLTTGSREEFQARNEFMQAEAQDIGETKRLAASNERGSDQARRDIKTEEFQQREAGLNSFVKDEMNLKRELLKVIDQEIKAVKAKEAAEKKAADALLGNSWEKAVEEMAAQGAMAAAAIGDPNIMSGYSRTDYGRASKNLDDLKKAGVDSYGGRDIDEVNVTARTEGLTRAGLDRDSADSMARQGIGESDEVRSKNKEALDIVSTMRETQGLQEDIIQSEIDVQKQLMESIKDLKIAVVENTKAVNGETEDSSEEGSDKDGSGKGSSGSSSGGSGSGSGSGSGGMESSSTSSMVHSDCCCDGVSKVKVVNAKDFETEAQKADTNSKSLAGLVLENPVIIARAMDAKPLVKPVAKAIKNALVPVGKAVKNTAQSALKAAKKVIPKGRPKPVSSLDPDFIGPRRFIGPKPADAADAAKAAAATKAATKTPAAPPPVQKPKPPPPRSVKTVQEQIIGSKGPQNPDLPPSPVDTKALDTAKARQATARTKLQQVDNLNVNKLPAQVKKIVDRVKPAKGKETAKLVEEILSEVRPGADGLTDITRKADMGILSKGNKNVDLGKLMKSAMDNMNWDVDKLYNNLISSWSGDMTPSFNSIATGRMIGFEESRLPEMQAEFTKNTGIDPKGMSSAYDEYADATKKVSDLQAAAPTPKAATQAVPPPSPTKGSVPPPSPRKGSVPPLPVQEQSIASKALDSVTEAVKSKINSGLDVAKGVPEIAKGLKESLKAKLPNVSMPEFKMPDLGIKDFVDGFRATEVPLNTSTPVNKAGLDELLEPEVLGKMGQAGADASKGLKKFLTILGPVADVADGLYSTYRGVVATEAERGNLAIDRGLDDQNTIYKAGISFATGEPTLGGSATSSLSGLVGGPTAEIGSNTDVSMAGMEAVARFAGMGAAAGSFIAPGVGTMVGGAAGAAIGGSAELIKAINFLGEDMKAARESAAKSESLRSASVNETGLDAVTRNLVNAVAQMELNLEGAKASGDSEKIKEEEAALANARESLDKRNKERSTGRGDLVARNKGRTNKSKTERNIKEDLKKQDEYLKKVKQAGKEERADAKSVEESKKKVLDMQKASASQESTGQFDYRTGLPIQTMFDTSQAEAEKEAQSKEANITTPTVKVEAQNLEDTSLEEERANNLASTPEQLKERGIESLYTEDDDLAMNDSKQPGDVKTYTPERIAEYQRMQKEGIDETRGGDPDLFFDSNRMTPSEGYSFSDELNNAMQISGEAPVSDKVVQPQATATDSVPTAAVEAPPAPGEQAMKTPASESGAGGAGTIAGAMGEVDPERQAKIKQMEEGAAEAAETKKEDLPKKEQEAIAEAMSKVEPTSTDDCCSQTLEILKQILEAVKNIGQYDPSDLGSMSVNSESDKEENKAEEKTEEKKSEDVAKAQKDAMDGVRKGLGIEVSKTLQEAKTEKEIQQPPAPEEYKEPRDNLGLTDSQGSQLARTERSETASGKLGRLAGASGAGSEFNQRMQDKEQRIIDQEKYKSAQDFVGGLDEEGKKEVMLGFDTKQENPFLAKGDYDNEKSNNLAQMQQQKRIAYAQKTGGRLRSEDENYLKFEADRKIAASAQSAEKNKAPDKVETAYATSIDKSNALEAGTGKFDINTQQEITNPLLPLIDSIDKDLKVAKEAGDSEKEKALLDEKALTKAASDVYTSLNPERKASDDIALSGNFYKDAIVLLKAILDAVSNCCGGSGGSAPEDLFNFTKVFDESLGKGVPQGVAVDSLGYKDIFKEKQADKALQETDDRSPSRDLKLMQKKPVEPKDPNTIEEKKRLTTGGEFDNGQFSAGNPFVGDVGGLGNILGTLANVGGLSSLGNAPSQMSMMPETASGLSGMTEDIMQLTETNSILTTIETAIQAVVTNTDGLNANNTEGEGNVGNITSELSSITSSFQSIFTTFTNDFTNAIARLENVSIEIRVQPLNVTVDLNGAGVLDKLKSYVGDEMIDQIATEIKKYKVGNNNRLSKGQSTLSNGGGGGF